MQRQTDSSLGKRPALAARCRSGESAADLPVHKLAMKMRQRIPTVVFAVQVGPAGRRRWGA